MGWSFIGRMLIKGYKKGKSRRRSQIERSEGSMSPRQARYIFETPNIFSVAICYEFRTRFTSVVAHPFIWLVSVTA
jgi:hypothetical protein